jgi:prepilin-type N-terminal cleavage/methylation domain-containing protein
MNKASFLPENRIMKRNKKTFGFTLIELLMVIAIIGILAGILIPTVGAVRKQANVAASKSQLSNYVNAIQMFKGEYGYLPFVTGSEDEDVDLSDDATSVEFIETLSGRDATTGESKSEGGNRRLIAFHSFSESEFFIDDSEEVDPTQIADRFNNTKITIVVDGDGDGKVTVKNSEGQSKEIRATVSAYVESDDVIGAPAYSLAD